MRAQGQGVLLRGLGAAPGRSVGPARVLSTPSLADTVAPGSILVLRVVNPYLAPLLFRAGGVITEEGGLLQHATTLAREFGIPAVVGAEGAVDVVQDGDVVEVRGDTGEVLLVRSGSVQ
jgi:pyruvate,water dikinase